MISESEEIQADFGLEPISDAALDGMLRAAHRRYDPALRRIRRPEAAVGMVDSPLGRLLIAQGIRGLLMVRFLDTDDTTELLEMLKRQFDLAEDRALTREIGGEILRFFSGDSAAISDRPVDLSLVQSPFQRRALTRLRRIPAGAVTTYQALAAASGSPSAQRAIGNTVAANPIPIYVPCHRVIKSDGSIGNYGGGVERKLKLLRAEGFTVAPGPRIPSAAVYGHLTTRIFCRPGCRAADRARRERMLIYADTKRAASAGLRPCKICRPA